MKGRHITIETNDLWRIYRERGLLRRKRSDHREVVALAGVDLKVEEGELFALLGPNGAGKSTLIKILATLLLPTRGSAFVTGLDVTRREREIRRRISLAAGGETTGYGILTVEENLWMFSQFYGIPTREARRRMGELMEAVALTEQARSKVHTLSTGMRQKLNFARAFISDPAVAFLDEPTLGLDVEVARQVRRWVKKWVSERSGRTVLLTTHYLTEAEELADRVAIVDRGKLLACDTPANLKRGLGTGSRFAVELAGNGGRIPELATITGVCEARSRVGQTEGGVSLELRLENDQVLPDVLRRLTASGHTVASLAKNEPNLEDVFFQKVGRGLEDDTSRRE